MTIGNAPPVTEMGAAQMRSRTHFLMQFDQPVTPRVTAELKLRGVTILADVPENGLLVSARGRVALRSLGVRYAATIDPSDKVSPLLSTGDVSNGYFLVELHHDVDLADGRSLLLNAGVELIENPDLGPHRLMIHNASADTIRNLTALDEVSYIFPASDDLARGIPVRACVGALTTNGATTQSIPTYGDGWDGPGLGSATVYYYYTNVTLQLSATAAKSEIARAMAQWANVVRVTWQPGVSATANQTVNILWGTYNHGDAYPFDGPGGVLAHTFYPANPNPEPIAGDMHLDDSESWHIGSNTDLFSVTLHELGHALGLGHSDNPSDVMYPYYKMASTLAAGDIAAVQTLYAAQTGSPSSPVNSPSSPTPVQPSTPTTPATPTTPNKGTDTTPPTLSIYSPGSTSVSTTSSSIGFSGVASDNVGVTSVTWSTSIGWSGTANGTTLWSATIPLVTGSNVVTIRAYDAAGNSSWRSVVVTKH